MAKEYGKGGHQRTKVDKELDYIFISEQVVKGVSFTEIQKQFPKERGYQLSYHQIYTDMRKVLDGWEADRKKLLDKHKALEIAKINRLETVYWDAWERSKDPTTKTIVKKGGQPKGMKDKKAIVTDYVTHETHTTESVGSSKWLTGIQWCIQMRCKIMGLGTDAKAGEDEGITPAAAPKQINFTVRGRKSNEGYQDAIEISEP